MKFDDIVLQLGEFGLYQKRLYFLVCLTGICVAFQTLASVFTLTVPKHRCAIPGYVNDTYQVQSAVHRNLINRTIPLEDGVFAKCDIRNVSASSVQGDDGQPVLPVEKCDRWVYDKSMFSSTIATHLDIVCEDKWVRTVSNSLVLAGKLVGSAIQSVISDIFGRRKAFIVCLFLMILTGFANYFVFNFATLMTFRFLAGLTTTSTFLGAFIIGLEFVGPSKRGLTGLVIELFWVLGMVLLSGIAFLLRDWHHLVLALAAPAVLFLSYWWLIPESPRWLLSKGRRSEAEVIIRNVAKVNKVTLPKTLFDEKTLDTEPQGRLIEMFTNRRLACRSIVLFYIWMVSSLIYYGLTLNVSNLSGNIYINFVLSALVEGVGYVMAILLLDRVGRRILLCMSMSLGGVACVLTIFPAIFAAGSADWSLMMLSLVGKMGSSAAFGVIYVFTAELYPTPLRNMGLGVSLTFSRIGGVVSPFVADLGLYVGGTFGETALPLVVFGVTAILAGGLALALPETLHKKLPETVEDAKAFGTGSWNRQWWNKKTSTAANTSATGGEPVT